MRIVKHRLLSLALIALLVQATLPYMLTDCPVYTQGAVAVHAAMPADCPMLALQAKAPNTDKHPVKQTSELTCPLCAVMSPLHSFVLAGLIALPPPPASFVKSSFAFYPAAIDISPQTASFSARAPPALG